MEEERTMKMSRRFFFSFHFFETTDFVCVCVCVCVYQNGNFLPGKSIFHVGKVTLPPLKNIPLTPLRQWSKSVECIYYLCHSLS